MKKIVRSRAPLRISFGGGGTEIDPYRSNSGGQVLNTSISLYAYTTIEEIDENKIIFNASDLNINESYDINSIINENDLISNSKLKIHFSTFKYLIKDFKIENIKSLKIVTYSDAPVGSGLGSSSTLTVSMIEAFNKYYNLGYTKYEIAMKAFHIERVILGLHGGQQDQFSASFGGFNFINFNKDGSVNLEPLNLSKKILFELESSMILAYTGISRDSAKIIESQIKKDINKDEKYIKNLDEIKLFAKKMEHALVRNDIEKFGNLLHQSWQKKRKLSKLITSDHIDNLYKSVRDLGAIGGKISGAGGGGFFMIICNPTHKGSIKNKLIDLGNEIFPVQFSQNGSYSWTIQK